jgi:dihydroflavonol-4-reductase
MKTILVTGGTGFLGKHLVEELKRQEPNSRLRLFRRRASVGEPDPLTEVVLGDITLPEDVSAAVEGVEEIYHLAGLVEREPRDPTRLYRTHIEGVRNVCEAVREQEVKKAVLVSSSGTVAVSREPVKRNEDSGYTNGVTSRWPYYAGKIFAEKLVFRYAEQEQLPIVVVNPSLLLGPGDERGSSTKDTALFLDGQVMAVPRGGLSIVDVRDAAAGLILAMRLGRPGERYILAGPNWTFREWMEKTAQLARVKAPKLQLPLWLSLWCARRMRSLLPLIGKSFELDDASIEMADLFWYCDSTKARRELGFNTRDPMETLRDTIKDIRKRKPER